MSQRKIIYSLLTILSVIALILAGIIFINKNQNLTVRFLDVGQGDAILISQGDKQILIDGGPNGQIILEKLGEYVPFWDRTIDVVIATHPDADHIGGLVDVMSKYEIGTVIDNGIDVDSKIYKTYANLIAEEKIKELDASLGMKLKLADDAELNILSPLISGVDTNIKDNNEESIVSRLAVGNDSFLFTGDISQNQESALIGYPLALNSRVLKVAHHGSKNSTSENFLVSVNPQEAIISVGKNRYGHPTEEVLKRLNDKGVRILRTDEVGDIVYICSEKERCQYDF